MSVCQGHIERYNVCESVSYTLRHAYATGLILCETCLIHKCDMNHSYVWHDSFICVTWRIHMCDMTHSYVWHDSFICVTWRIHDVIYGWVMSHIEWGLSHMDETCHPRVTCVCVWHVCVCDKCVLWQYCASGRIRKVQNTTSCHNSGTMNLNSIRISTVRGHAPYKYLPRNTIPKSPGTNSNRLRISCSDTSFSLMVWMLHIWMSHVTYGQGMSHIWMSHVTHMNESCHTYEWFMLHMDEACHTYDCVMLHMNEACHTYEWGMSHADEACHTYEWGMSHIWMRHVTHMNESCYMKMRHVTHMNESCYIWMKHVTHMNESCHHMDEACHT